MNGMDTLPGHEREILWSEILGCRRAELHTGMISPPTPEQAETFGRLRARRLAGEPLQYLSGAQGFRKLDLEVGPGVLIPRPETEIVVERCLEVLRKTQNPRVIDVGTGSGAIALSIATERPDAEVWATDVSEDALRWAGKNVSRTAAGNVHLLRGDLFQPLPGSLAGTVHLVVSNPPYLSERELREAEPDVRDHEPSSATVAGSSGMEVYRRLVPASPGWLRAGGWLVLETSENKWSRLRTLLLAGFVDVAMSRDLAGKIRVAEGRKP